MTVKGNHPLAEILAKKLFSIETVPVAEQRRMVNRAINAGVEYHKAEIKKFAEFERIDKIRIEEGLEEIKKLRKALDYPGDIPLMIQRAMAREREGCAIVCDDLYNDTHDSHDAYDCAEAIRARGEE